MFDPRGLVGFTRRLDAEIRVIQLPPAKDPDDLIREEPERWLELVQQARPVVEFYMDKLLDSANLDDGPQKKAVVDALLPLLRNVGNPVERSSYAQRLVRALDISAPQFLHELERQTQRAARSRHGADDTAVSNMLLPSKTDLERYCLTTLVRHATTLGEVNQFLVGEGLQPLSTQDFLDAGWRTIFEAWQALETVGEQSPGDKLSAVLPAELQPQLQEILKNDDLETGGEGSLRDTVRTILRLREPILAQRVQDLFTLVRDARGSGDDQPTEYESTLRSYLTALRNVRKTLAHTRAKHAVGSDPRIAAPVRKA